MSIATKMAAIADKIRSLLGLTGKMGLDAMNNNLQSIQNNVDSQATLIYQVAAELVGKGTGSGDAIVPIGTKTITANGTYDISVYAEAEVNVPSNEASGTKRITANGTYDVVTYANAEVNVPSSASGTTRITANGLYDVAAFANAEVDIPSGSNFDTLIVTPQATQQFFDPEDVDGYSSVTIYAIPYKETVNSSGGKMITIGGDD